jgi:hypothetical protein
LFHFIRLLISSLQTDTKSIESSSARDDDTITTTSSSTTNDDDDNTNNNSSSSEFHAIPSHRQLVDRDFRRAVESDDDGDDHESTMGTPVPSSTTAEPLAKFNS